MQQVILAKLIHSILYIFKDCSFSNPSVLTWRVVLCPYFHASVLLGLLAHTWVNVGMLRMGMCVHTPAVEQPVFHVSMLLGLQQVPHALQYISYSLPAVSNKCCVLVMSAYNLDTSDVQTNRLIWVKKWSHLTCYLHELKAEVMASLLFGMGYRKLRILWGEKASHIVVECMHNSYCVLFGIVL